MRKSCLLAILWIFLASSVLASLVTVTPDMACRIRSDDNTYGSETVPPGDGNNHDTRKLTVRNGPDRGEKSYIRFVVDPNILEGLRSATLTIICGRSRKFHTV